MAYEYTSHPVNICGFLWLSCSRGKKQESCRALKMNKICGRGGGAVRLFSLQKELHCAHVSRLPARTSNTVFIQLSKNTALKSHETKIGRVSSLIVMSHSKPNYPSLQNVFQSYNWNLKSTSDCIGPAFCLAVANTKGTRKTSLWHKMSRARNYCF